MGRAAPLLACCALIAAGCGSSSSGSTNTLAATTTSTTTGSATDAGTIQGNELDQMPKAPEPSGSAPTLSGSSVAGERTYLRAVFNDAQAFWQHEFSAANLPYTPAVLTLFSQAVESSGCGAQADVGPFYCGANHGIYLDIRFFQLLAQRFGVGGFAQAYIVGHEFGHHVQNQTGLQHRLAAADQQDPAGQNARSVRYELMADCLSGVWAHSVYRRGELTDQDLEQALKTAAVIGDDFQRRMAGRPMETALWTHGSSAQRQHWLRTGFDTGDPGACDTFTQTSP
jgi:predicted metalloprotease